MSAPGDFVSDYRTVGSLRLHALVAASSPGAPTIVLIPGLVTASRSMVPLARQLVTRGLGVWILDPPGFGYSDKPTRALAMTEQAGILAGWLYATGLAPARVLGNSFGSQVAAVTAADHPDIVQRLVLLAPTADPRIRGLLSWVRMLPGPRGSRDRAAGRGRAVALSHVHDLLSDPPTLRVLNAGEYALASLLRAVSTVRCAVLERIEAVLPQITVPTLVVRAEHDHLSSPEWARRIAELAPRGRLHELAGLGHAAFYSSPTAVAEVTAPFLRADQATSTA